jgi:hypothetical protein
VQAYTREGFTRSGCALGTIGADPGVPEAPSVSIRPADHTTAAFADRRCARIDRYGPIDALSAIGFRTGNACSKYPGPGNLPPLASPFYLNTDAGMPCEQRRGEQENRSGPRFKRNRLCARRNALALKRVLAEAGIISDGATGATRSQPRKHSRGGPEGDN